MLIYDKMFEALQGESQENLNRLVFKCFESDYAFNRALSFCKNVNIKLENYSTLLHYICMPTRPFVKQALRVIELGADLNSIDQMQSSPLLYAIRSRHDELDELLIEKGAQLDSDELKGTILFHCLECKFDLNK